MKPSEIFRENAENCAQLAAAEGGVDGPAYKRFKRMEAAWQALAEEQAWLDGEVTPENLNGKGKTPTLWGGAGS